ncbi:beta-1 adrenergic receptor-like [Amphiura filiformis]|uniref:beta-1 adrenergic receptor-like n=1 Tax=Amphiura filiformis TaxID=82378 RepID=UPI003B212290
MNDYSINTTPFVGPNDSSSIPSIPEDVLLNTGFAWFRITIVSVNAVLIIAGNILNLIVLPRLKNTNETTKVYLLSLAIVDLTTGLQTSVFGVGTAIAAKWIFGRTMCVVIGVLIISTGGTSFIVLCLMSADRYVAITKPLQYSQLTSRKRAIMLICTCLIPYPVNIYFLSTINDLFDNVTYSPGKGQCLVDFGNPEIAALSISELSIFILCPIVVFALVYLRILLIAWKAAKNIDSQTPSGQQRGRIFSRSEWRATRTTLLITCAFSLAWLPFPITGIWEASTGARLTPTAAFLVTLLPAFNAWWNVVIYSVMNREYRRTAKMVFGCNVGRDDFGPSSAVAQCR